MPTTIASPLDNPTTFSDIDKLFLDTLLPSNFFPVLPSNLFAPSPTCTIYGDEPYASDGGIGTWGKRQRSGR